MSKLSAEWENKIRPIHLRSYGLQSQWWKSRHGGCQVGKKKRKKKGYPYSTHSSFLTDSLSRLNTTSSHEAACLKWDVCLEYQDYVLCTNKSHGALGSSSLKEHWMLSSLPWRALQFNPTQAATPLRSDWWGLLCLFYPCSVFLATLLHCNSCTVADFTTFIFGDTRFVFQMEKTAHNKVNYSFP